MGRAGGNGGRGAGGGRRVGGNPEDAKLKAQLAAGRKQANQGKDLPPMLYLKLSGEDTLRQLLTRYDRHPKLQVSSRRGTSKKKRAASICSRVVLERES